MRDRPRSRTARVLEGAERDSAFAEQARRFPGFAAYHRKTERIIPVIALLPTEGTPS